LIDTVPYLGAALQVVEQPGRQRAHRRGDIVLVPRGAERRAALERWYRRAARTEIGRRLDDACRQAGTAVKLTIVEPGGDDCRGRIEAHRIDWEQGSAELAVWVAPQLRRRGVARRALRLAAGWLLETVGLHSLTLRVEADNVAMLRAAEAAGFERRSDGAIVVLGLDSRTLSNT